MAKNKTGMFKKSLIGVLALLGMAGSGNSAFLPANNSTTVKQRDAINKGIETPAPQSIKKDFSGGDNPFKHYKRGTYNQRQYRKLLRQNPHFRNSKKCKL